MKTCIMVYGRFNPVHKGHAMIFGTGLTLHKSIPDSDFKIFMSTTDGDSKNPLPHHIKREMIEYHFPVLAKYIQDIENQGDSLFSTLEMLDPYYDRLILLCGSDRYQHFNLILSKYNGTLYDFEDIEVYNLGERGVSPYSSTAMRQAVIDNDFETFSSGLSGTEMDRKYFNILKTFMGVEIDDI